MIVYIATFGRSGSTFFRIILNKVFGYPSYAGLASSEDLTTIGAEDMAGYKPFSELVPHWDSPEDLLTQLRKLDNDNTLYFIKTHSANPLSATPEMQTTHNITQDEQDNFKCIVLVRDGRDTLISYAQYFINLKFTWKTWLSFSGNYPHRITSGTKEVTRFKQETFSFLLTLSGHLCKILGMRTFLFHKILKGLIREAKWDQYHKRIFSRQGQTIIVHFDDLIKDPINTVQTALNTLGIPLSAKDKGDVPNFQDLNQLFPEFFNSGKSGRWKKEMPEHLHQLFWQTHGTTMEKLGYQRATPPSQTRAPLANID